jgi:hypothetical protein
MGRMSATQTYRGGCHCGKVRYEVKLDLTNPVTACNCSMCGRAGTFLSFVPAGEFKLLSGGEALTDYQFNRHNIHHLFCSVCGIKSFARGSKGDQPMVAINARCLDDVDLSKLQVNHVNGKGA